MNDNKKWTAERVEHAAEECDAFYEEAIDALYAFASILREREAAKSEGAQQTEVQAGDAERYRWIKAKPFAASVGLRDGWLTVIDMEDWDSLIDAAIAEQKGEAT